MELVSTNKALPWCGAVPETGIMHNFHCSVSAARLLLTFTAVEVHYTAIYSQMLFSS